MRISGGRARGITLKVPKGDAVRPATDGLRQSVFSSLGTRVEGARFLDLCAGSGAYGLEAISRGASGGVSVEKSPRAVAFLRENVAAVLKSAGMPPGSVTVAHCDLLDWHPTPDFSADLVFVDPPYELIERLEPQIFAKLDGWLAKTDDPIVVFEMPGEQALSPEGWREVRRIGRGGSRQPTAAIFRRAPRIPPTQR